MTLVLAGLVIAAIGAPHLLVLDRSPSVVAAAIWLAALALRAVMAVFCALFVVLYLPTTELFSLISHWCWDAVVPLLATNLPLDGHAVGDAALIAPASVLAASTLAVLFGLWRAGRRVRRLVSRSVIGSGPHESLVLADGDVLVAAAGLRRPRVVVSAGALLAFDDAELAASLEHEHGHIVRRHRYVFVAAELCRALARFLPGTGTAARELVFHLERDADRYALARRHDPAALASAICKAAGERRLAAPTLALGGGIVTRRIGLLLDTDACRQPRHDRTLRLLAVAMCTLAVAALSALPAVARAGLNEARAAQTSHHCTS